MARYAHESYSYCLLFRWSFISFTFRVPFLQCLHAFILVFQPRDLTSLHLFSARTSPSVTSRLRDSQIEQLYYRSHLGHSSLYLQFVPYQRPAPTTSQLISPLLKAHSKAINFLASLPLLDHIQVSRIFLASRRLPFMSTKETFRPRQWTR